MRSARTTWISGASVVALLIVIAAWLLLLSPVRDESAIAHEEAQAVEDSNLILESRVVALRKQFAELDSLRGELSEFEKKIPPTVDYDSLVAELERSAEESEIALLSITADGAIEPVAPFTAIKVTPPPAAPAEGEDAPEPTPTPTEIVTVSGQPPTATGALSEELEGFYQLPLQLVVQGSYEEALAFSDAIQVGSTRALLVHSVEVTAMRKAQESSSAPAAEDGDLQYSLNALVYVLESAVLEYDQANASTEDSSQPKVLPKPAKENRFAPER